MKKLSLVPVAGFKREDKRKQIDTQRKHPEKGNDGDFLANIVCRGKQERGSEKTDRYPERGAKHSHIFGVLPDCCRVRVCVLRFRVSEQQSTHRVNNGVNEIGDGPKPGLLLKPEHLFKQKRVRKKAKQRTGIGQRVKAIRRSAGEGTGKPVLQQRACGGENQERQAGRHSGNWPRRRTLAIRAESVQGAAPQIGRPARGCPEAETRQSLRT